MPTLAARVASADLGHDFGQTDFGQTDFGQNEFDLLCGVLCCVVLCVVCVAWVLVSRFQSGVSCAGVGFKVWFGPPFSGPPFSWTALPLDRPAPKPPGLAHDNQRTPNVHI